jgi:5,10-methenyltetrahydrofolate synthetase
MITLEKAKVRKEIASLKQRYTREELLAKSIEVCKQIEASDVFQQAINIFTYNAMKDEVSTIALMERWKDRKKFYFPVVAGNELIFREINDATLFERSSIGVNEPKGMKGVGHERADLILVPGVAFDRNRNRLGRGKGYYDRFLSDSLVTKVGICFEFQLIAVVPADEGDIKMDLIISEHTIS